MFYLVNIFANILNASKFNFTSNEILLQYIKYEKKIDIFLKKKS